MSLRGKPIKLTDEAISRDPSDAPNPSHPQDKFGLISYVGLCPP